MRLVGMGDIAYLLSSVVPLRLLLALARVQGRLIYSLRGRRVSAVRNNFRTTFGRVKSDVEIERMTRQFFEYRQLRSLLWILAPRLSSTRLAELFPTEGLEHLDQARSRKRGVILLGCHLNSLCMFIAVMMLRKRGYDVRVALVEPGDPWAHTAVARLIRRLSKGKSLDELLGAFHCQFNIRPIVRCLSENAIVSQTGDGRHSARFVDVEFLGRSLPFTTGMFSVAQLTGASVVPIFQVGAPPDTLRFVLEESFTVDKGDRPQEALRATVAAYAKRLEHHLLENIPCWEHWLVPDTLDAMAGWREHPLSERYRV